MVVQYPNGYHFMSLNGWLIKKYPVNQISETFEKLFQNTLKNYMDELHNSYQLSPEQYALLIICPQSRKIKQLKPHIFWYTFYFFFLAWGTIAFLAKASKSYQKEWLRNLRAIKISTFTKIAWLYLTTWLQFKEKMFGSQ